MCQKSALHSEKVWDTVVGRARTAVDKIFIPMQKYESVTGQMCFFSYLTKLIPEHLNVFELQGFNRIGVRSVGS